MKIDFTKTPFIIGICVLAAFLALFFTFLILLCKKRNEQPVKSKSPLLLLFEFIGNFISTLAICGLLTVGSFYQSTEKSDGRTMMISVILSEIIGVPIMLLSYILRALQLYRIYNIVPDDSRSDSSNSLSSFYKTHGFKLTKYYVKLLIYASLLFIVVGFGMILGYILNWDFLDDGIYEDYRNFVLMTSTLFINFIGPFTLGIFGIHLLKQADREISMNKEIILTIIFWMISTGVFHLFLNRYLFRMTKPSQIKYEDLIAIICSGSLIIRNIFCFILSVVHPIVKSNVQNIIPYGETRECVEGVDIALSTEIPYLYFSKFIEEKHKTAGKALISLHAKVKIYEDFAKNEQSIMECEKMALDILQDYENCKFTLDISKDNANKISELLRKRIEEFAEKGYDEKLFDPLYGYMINQFQKYFKEFKKSPIYYELYDQLRQNEIIYERLLNSKLI